MQVSPTQDAVMVAMRSFLTAVLPAAVVVVQGTPNRVPEPVENEMAVMSPPRFSRLETTVDSFADVSFTGSIAGTAMTVTAVAFGAIAAGATVFGTGVAAGTKVVSGPGGVGAYVVDTAQTVGSTKLSSGAKTATQNADATIQIDFHSASGAGGDYAQIVSTLMRDPFATEQFAAQPGNSAGAISPLHADDPRFMPFHNEAMQVEWRWVVDAHLQADQAVSIPQQFADQIAVEVVSVDAEYPADG